MSVESKRACRKKLKPVTLAAPESKRISKQAMKYEGKAKAAKKKLRVKGMFMGLEQAKQLLDDKKELKRLKLGRVELKHLIKEYETGQASSKRR